MSVHSDGKNVTKKELTVGVNKFLFSYTCNITELKLLSFKLLGKTTRKFC